MNDDGEAWLFENDFAARKKVGAIAAEALDKMRGQPL